MKKIISLGLSTLFILTGCSVNIGGQERQVAKIQASQEYYNHDQGVILALYENPEEKIIEIQLENNQRQAYYADQVNNFSDLSVGDEISYFYDDIRSIVDLEVVKEAPDEGALDTYSVERINPSTINTNNLNEYKTISLLSYDNTQIDGISIYTDAPGEDDQFSFGDENRFVIVAYTDNGDYKLFDEVLADQAPSIDIYHQGNIFELIVSFRGPQGVGSKLYTHRNNVFEVEDIYLKDTNINFIGNI